jgi:hypothetical protein
LFDLIDQSVGWGNFNNICSDLLGDRCNEVAAILKKEMGQRAYSLFCFEYIAILNGLWKRTPWGAFPQTQKIYK